MQVPYKLSVMKTIRNFIIVATLILVFFFTSYMENSHKAYAACVFGPNGTQECTGPNHSNPMISQSITVTTNHEKYVTGDDIVITGNISNPDNKTRPIIRIYNPNHEFLFYKFFQPSIKNYTWSVSTVNFWLFDPSGNYTVSAYYGDDYAETHFYLDSNLTQYLYSSSPLRQFKIGNSAQDVHCHVDLRLIIKAEDFSPACVHSITATTLILRDWAIGFAPIQPFIGTIDIIGLQQNYTVGQPINVTANYTGYWVDSNIPDVKIFSANGTQVWYNCPECGATKGIILGGGTFGPRYGTFTYNVSSANGLPVINETGTYTIVASVANKTAQAKFTVIVNQNSLNKNYNSTGTAYLPASFMPCDTPYPQSNTGLAVLYMPTNSIGKLCVRYSNFNDSPARVGIRIFNANNLNHDTPEISTWNDLGNNTTIPKGNSTVVYWIKTGNQSGFYGLTIFCVGMPFAVGYDNDSRIISSDFPWLGGTIYCPMQSYNFHIDSMTGIGVKYIPHP